MINTWVYFGVLFLLFSRMTQTYSFARFDNCNRPHLIRRPQSLQHERWRIVETREFVWISINFEENYSIFPQSSFQNAFFCILSSSYIYT